MSVFVDYLDLRTAVVEMIGNADITDVFPRFVKMAESDFNRRLRCREQIETASLSVADGRVDLPAGMSEPIGLFRGNGAELVQQSVQVFERLADKRGFYAVLASEIAAADGDYSFQYYAKVPTLATSSTTSNWLLQKHPELYLYAVAEKAAKHLVNAELATATGSLAETEYKSVAAQDYSERFARARVRVGGITP